MKPPRSMESQHVNCGGTISLNSLNGEEYIHCNKCCAFRYLHDGDKLPTGRDRGQNIAAWDAGELRSPGRIRRLYGKAP